MLSPCFWACGSTENSHPTFTVFRILSKYVFTPCWHEWGLTEVYVGGVHIYQNGATSESRTVGQVVLFQFRALYFALMPMDKFSGNGTANLLHPATEFWVGAQSVDDTARAGRDGAHDITTSSPPSTLLVFCTMHPPNMIVLRPGALGGRCADRTVRGWSPH